MSKIAVHLSIFRDRMHRDLEGTLDRVADSGYEGVEFRYSSGMMSARGLRLHLESRELGLAGLSLAYGQLEEEAEAIGYLLEAGGRFLMVSGPSGRQSSAETYQEMADALSKAGELAAGRGAELCYVNDSLDFEPVGDSTGLAFLCDATDASLVKLCPDTYSIAESGKDPAVFIHKHRKRIASIHLTDGRPDQADLGAQAFTELGIGSLDIPSIMKMAALANPEWIASAQATSTLPPAESVRRSREYLREIGY